MKEYFINSTLMPVSANYIEPQIMASSQDIRGVESFECHRKARSGTIQKREGGEASSPMISGGKNVLNLDLKRNQTPQYEV